MRLTLLSMLLALICSLQAQDTVYVTNKNTTYITFPEDISYFDIGLPNNFVADVGQGKASQQELKDNFDSKMLKLRCIKPTQDVSSLMIKFGDRYEMLNLKFVETPKKQFHRMYQDLNKGMGMAQSVAPAKVLPVSSTTVSANINGSNDRIKARADSVLKMRNELKEYAFIDDYLKASVTCIRNDNMNTYVKIAINNSSSIPYKFDFISFQYVQKMKKGAIKSKKKAPQDVFPVYSPPMADIPANQGRYVVYAIPSFGLANNGYLLVLFREKNGDRVLKIYIPSNIIQGSAQIK